MTTDPKKNALNREAILKLLTDAEISKVSRAEDAQRLVEGDEWRANAPIMSLGAPRVCGDDPIEATGVQADVECSPRMRG
jgi:hypothetical protein